MANYSSTFDSAGTGSGLPTGWSARWNATTAWSRVDTGGGDIAVRRNTATAARSGASLDAVDSDADRDDADILVKVRTASVASSQTHIGAFARGSGAAGAETGYAAAIYGTALRLLKYDAGAFTILNTSSSLGIAVDTWYWLRLRVNAATQQARIWLVGDTEPGTWNVSGTDSAITAAGWCGLFGSYGSSTNQDWADVAIGTNGDVATMSGGGSAPTVSSHPTDQTVTEPATATFTASFANSPTSYQWEVSTDGGSGWGNVTTGSGGTTASYTTAATSVSGGDANDGDLFRCTATNGSGSVTTDPAELIVNASGDTTPPTLTGSLSSSSITQTGFTIDGPSATDDTAVTGYDFSTDGGSTWPITGWAAPSYNFTGLTAGTTYGVRMRARDAAGNVSSALALSVDTLPPGATLTSSPLKDNTGTLHLSAPFEAFIHDPDTGALVLHATSLTSHASTGVVTVTNAALSAAAAYRVVWVRTDTGAEGLQTLTAA